MSHFAEDNSECRQVTVYVAGEDLPCGSAFEQREDGKMYVADTSKPRLLYGVAMRDIKAGEAFGKPRWGVAGVATLPALSECVSAPDDDCDTPLVAGEPTPAGQPGPGMMAYGGVEFTVPTLPSPTTVIDCRSGPQGTQRVNGSGRKPQNGAGTIRVKALAAQVNCRDSTATPGQLPGSAVSPRAQAGGVLTTLQEACSPEKVQKAVAELTYKGVTFTPLFESTSPTGKGDLIEAIVRPPTIDDARAMAKEIVEKAKAGKWVALPSTKYPAHAPRKIILKVPDGKPLESFECRPIHRDDGKVLRTVYTIILPPGTEVSFED